MARDELLSVSPNAYSLKIVGTDLKCMLWRNAFAEYNFFATEAQRKQRMKPLNKLFSVFFSALVAIFFDKFERK